MKITERKMQSMERLKKKSTGEKSEADDLKKQKKCLCVK